MSEDDAFAIKPTDFEKLDRVAEGHGFVSRETKRRRNATGPAMPVNVKLPEKEYNAFIKFCDEHDLTYRKAIAKLLKMAGYLE